MLQLSSPSYQVADAQHAIELVRHGVVLQSHEQGVEHDADGDAQVQEGVHHHELHPLLHPQPPGAALPDQVPPREGDPAGVALLLGLLQLWGTDQGSEEARV